MIFHYQITQIGNNTFHRVFQEVVDSDTYKASWNDIIKVIDKSKDTINLVSDYTDCKILIDESEFLYLVNYLRMELSFINKIKCAAIANSEENITRLAIWKEFYILHGIYLIGKVFSDKNRAFEFIGIKHLNYMNNNIV